MSISALALDQAATVSAYWDQFAGSHLNSSAHWEANEPVRRHQWSLITGAAEINPVTWFMNEFGPFERLASLCSGTGLLERHVADQWLRSKGHITGFDISPRSVEIAAEAAKGMPGIDYAVRDMNDAIWPDTNYDAVFAHGALHHIAKLDHLMGQVRAHMHPHGLLYVNDYVGPARFQWSDVQMRLADQLLTEIPSRFVVKPHVERCNPTSLAELDPSEAVCSNFILDSVGAHFRIQKRVNRGGTLLAPIFGSGCLDPSIIESGGGLAAIGQLCERETALIESGVISSDHVVLVCRPRR